MLRLKKTMSGALYRKAVTALFIGCVIVCGAGSVFLSFDYLAVYNTANSLSVGITQVINAVVDPDSRLLTITLRIENRGSRILDIYRYDITVWLNDRYIAQEPGETRLLLEPGEYDTRIFNILVDDIYAERIIEAEQSGQWNWIIQYPMRMWISWLHVTFSYLGEEWQGVNPGDSPSSFTHDYIWRCNHCT